MVVSSRYAFMTIRCTEYYRNRMLSGMQEVPLGVLRQLPKRCKNLFS